MLDSKCDRSTVETLLDELKALVKRRGEIDHMIEFLERLEGRHVRPGEQICTPLDWRRVRMLN